MPWAAVAVLAVLAGALRALQAGDGLLGDELATLFDVRIGGLGDMLALLRDGHPVSNEFTPPLSFVLAWLADQALPGTAAIRIPSVIASVALVPVLFALGRRAAGDAAGLVAAAAWALSAFGIYYGSEARGYALLMLLGAASTLVLLSAIRDGGRGRWALFAVLTAGILYTHYTGAGVVVAQGLWALLFASGRRRAVVLAHAGAFLLYVPWLPFVRQDETVGIYQAVGPQTAVEYVKEALRAFPGHPYLDLSEVLTRPAGALLGAVVLAAAAYAVARRRPASARALAGSPTGLLIALAVATPLALLALGAATGGVGFLARSLAASLPAGLVLLGAALTAPPRRYAAAATGLALAVLAFGAVRVSAPEHRRPAYDELARFVDARARPQDPVWVVTPFAPWTSGSTFMAAHFERPHPELRITGGSEAVWRSEFVRGERIYAIVPSGIRPEWMNAPPGPPGLYAEVERRRAPGFNSSDAVVYRRR